MNIIIKAAKAVVEDNFMLTDKMPGSNDCYGINAIKLWRLKNALENNCIYDEYGHCFECDATREDLVKKND